MGRSLSFDRDQVLKNAMTVFWHKGYAATSMKDLLSATGLHQGSLYSAFTNKRELYLEALTCYFDQMIADMAQVLVSSSSPLQAIHTLFDGILAECVQDEKGSGCLIINSITELSAHDEDVMQRLNIMDKKMTIMLGDKLAAAQQQGELDNSMDPQQQARLLLTGSKGLRVYALLKPGEEALSEVVTSLLQALPRPSK